MDVEVSLEGFRLGGVDVQLPMSETALEQILGEPSRYVGEPWRQNRLLVWDSFGVVAYQSNETKEVRSLAFYLVRVPDRDFCPQAAYPGRLLAAGDTVTSASTLDEVGHRILRAGGTHESRLALGVWNLDYGNLGVTLEEMDSSTLQTFNINAPS